MREILPQSNQNIDQYLNELPPSMQNAVEKIRQQKKDSTRPLPSTTLIDHSQILNADKRTTILDKVAMLVDENIFGRCEMCSQFALLLARAIKHAGFNARAVKGNAKYRKQNGDWFTWEHAWVEANSELIDGNVDSMVENPMIPMDISPFPFWGKKSVIPDDREFLSSTKLSLHDPDVEKIWWPDLRNWLTLVLGGKRDHL